VLDDEPAPSPQQAVAPDRVDDDEDDSGEVVGFDDPAGLSGDPAARWPTFWWGLWTVLAALVVWRVRKVTRRWWVYVLGAPVVLVLLFVFFENVSRLLPANI
jgi:hypothetical protein